MEVQLSKRYPVAAGQTQAWAVLGNLQATAACMPGAALTESIDERHHKGTVRAKVGPAQLLFNGELEVLALAPEDFRLELLGKGSDRGGSSATLRLKAWLEPVEPHVSCELVGEATVTVSGKLAQLGSRLLVPVSDALLAQFAVNFERAAQAVPVEALLPVQVEVTGPAAMPAISPTGLPPVQPPATPQATPQASPQANAAAPSLNALALAWTVLKTWLLGLFKGKS